MGFLYEYKSKLRTQTKWGWGTGVFTQNLASTWCNRKSRLSQILDRIQNIHVSCEDAITCIRRWDSPQTLFYCDPPYPRTNQGHYKNYTIDDFRLLCNTLDDIQGSYVLSNYHQEIEPKSAQKKLEIKAIMSASGKDRVGIDRSLEKQERSEEINRKEILWVCDRSVNSRKALKKLMSHQQIKQLSFFDKII